MNEVWMIDYLNAVFPHWGVFESEEAAWKWIDATDEDSDRSAYKPFMLTVNRDGAERVPHTAPNRRYINQR